MKTIRKQFLSVLSLAVLAFAAPSVYAQAPAHLNIGDPAPLLKPEKWVKGSPVPRFEKGKLYVVEFWATWCGPCKENIPHLTEMAKKYKDKVSIIGVDIWENAKPGEGDPMERVVKFVKQKGAGMDYIVAADGSASTIANSWMKPAGEQGIPCSFIVDKEGKIAWIGHPATLGAVLEKVVAGTYNSSPAQQEREAHMQLMEPITEAIAAKNYPATVTAIESAVAKQPSLFVRLAYPYLDALFHSDDKKAVAESRKIITEAGSGGASPAGAYQMVSSILASEPGLSQDSYKFGVTILNEALQQWPKDYMYSLMKASVAFNMGNKDQAISLAKGALTAAQDSEQKSPEAIALIQKSIARYEEAK